MTTSRNQYSNNNTYACSSAGGGAMYIPEAIERINNNIHQSELDMSSVIKYDTLIEQPAPTPSEMEQDTKLSA